MFGWKQNVQRIAPFLLTIVICCVGITLKHYLWDKPEPNHSSNTANTFSSGSNLPEDEVEQGNSYLSILPETYTDSKIDSRSDNQQSFQGSGNGFAEIENPTKDFQPGTLFQDSASPNTGNTPPSLNNGLQLIPPSHGKLHEEKVDPASGGLGVIGHGASDPSQLAATDLPPVGSSGSLVQPASGTNLPNQQRPISAQYQWPENQNRLSGQTNPIPSNYPSTDSALKDYSNGNRAFAKVDNPFLNGNVNSSPRLATKEREQDFSHRQVPSQSAGKEMSVLDGPISNRNFTLITQLTEPEERIIENHLNLSGRYARKEAFLMAESEAKNALNAIAKARKRSGDNTLAVKQLQIALTAYKEIVDFSSESRLSSYSVSTIVKGHDTTLLNDDSLTQNATIEEAREAYLQYAEENLLRAVGKHPLASHGLHTLGKIHLVQSNRASKNPSVHYATAGSLYSVALRSDGRNAKSANDLAVWLAQQNQLELAKELLIQAVKQSPMFTEAWQNLSTVHYKLGENRLAEIAAGQATAVNRPNDAGGSIAFVSAQEFEKAGDQGGRRYADRGLQNATQKSTNPYLAQQADGRGQIPRPSVGNGFTGRTFGQSQRTPQTNSAQYAPFGLSRAKPNGSATRMTPVEKKEPNFLQRTWESRPKIKDLLPWPSGQSTQNQQSAPGNRIPFGGF